MPWPQDALPVAFTTGEAEAAGISRHRLNRAQRSGRLWRPTPGVYVDLARFTTQRWPDRHRTLARVAPLHVRDSVVSHVSAALLGGLPHPPSAQGQVRLTLERTPRVNRASDWVHLHRAGLPSDHVTTLDGVPVTTVARTVVDCCRELRTPHAVAIADAALRAGSVTTAELVSMFAFQHRWPGASRSRGALPLVDPRRENWFESASAALLHRDGVPLGTPQVEVFAVSGELLGRVDFLWAEVGVIGEADGSGKLLGEFDEEEQAHSPERVARRVIALGERSTRLREAGFEVFHWTPAELLRDSWVVARRYFDAARRARPDRVNALWRCACCKRDLTSCRWATRITLRPPATLYAAGAGRR
jgi:hypothetical protein